MSIEHSEGEKLWVGIDIGFDVSAVCLIDQMGEIVREEEVQTTASEIGQFLERYVAGSAQLIGLEASSYSAHLVRGLRELGHPVAMFDSRQARKFLRISQNKTDRNDARGLAQIARHGRNVVAEVRVKSVECQTLRSQLVMRQHLVRNRVAAESAIKSVIRLNGGDVKTTTTVKRLRKNVIAELERLKSVEGLDLFEIIEPVLGISEQLRTRLARIDEALSRAAERIDVCRRFMAITGIGPIGALSFYTAVEEPARFKRSEDIGPYLGMVPYFKQSGPIIRRRGISRMGNKLTRQHLANAASIHIRRAPEDGAIRRWSESLRERVASPKVRMAVARKLAVVMLAMWKNGTDYCSNGLLRTDRPSDLE